MCGVCVRVHVCTGTSTNVPVHLAQTVKRGDVMFGAVIKWKLLGLLPES